MTQEKCKYDYSPSPTPWCVVKQGFKRGFASVEMCEGGYEVVASCREDNAQFIVQACNSHHLMLAALKRCYEVFRMDEIDTAISMQVGMAISKAEGKK